MGRGLSPPSYRTCSAHTKQARGIARACVKCFVERKLAAWLCGGFLLLDLLYLIHQRIGFLEQFVPLGGIARHIRLLTVDQAEVGYRVIVIGPKFNRLFQSGNALVRSEEHTSELQSLRHLVCRLLLE